MPTHYAPRLSKEKSLALAKLLRSENGGMSGGFTDSPTLKGEGAVKDEAKGESETWLYTGDEEEGLSNVWPLTMVEAAWPVAQLS